MYRIPGNVLSVLALTVAIGIAAFAQGQTTYYVDAACGNDTWYGTNVLCQDPDGPMKTNAAGIMMEPAKITSINSLILTDVILDKATSSLRSR